MAKALAGIGQAIMPHIVVAQTRVTIGDLSMNLNAASTVADPVKDGKCPKEMIIYAVSDCLMMDVLVNPNVDIPSRNV